MTKKITFVFVAVLLSIGCSASAAKAPRAGEVKTRLTPPLSPQKAADRGILDSISDLISDFWTPKFDRARSKWAEEHPISYSRLKRREDVIRVAISDCVGMFTIRYSLDSPSAERTICQPKEVSDIGPRPPTPDRRKMDVRASKKHERWKTKFEKHLARYSIDLAPSDVKPGLNVIRLNIALQRMTQNNWRILVDSHVKSKKGKSPLDKIVRNKENTPNYSV